MPRCTDGFGRSRCRNWENRGGREEVEAAGWKGFRNVFGRVGIFPVEFQRVAGRARRDSGAGWSCDENATSHFFEFQSLATSPAAVDPTILRINELNFGSSSKIFYL